MQHGKQLMKSNRCIQERKSLVFVNQNEVRSEKIIMIRLPENTQLKAK